MTRYITYKEIDLEIEFDYSPEEKMVRYYSDGSGYPGCAAEVCINEILYKGTDVYDLYESLECIDDIELLVFEEM